MAETLGEWRVQDPEHVSTDDLVDAGERNWKIVVDSFGWHVHHVALGMSREDAELVARLVNEARAAEAGE